MNERFYMIKIQLLDIEPAIWRRFVVPASITLDRLHDVIQIVMGWTDSHLHAFRAHRERAGVTQSFRAIQCQSPACGADDHTGAVVEGAADVFEIISQ